MGFEFDREEELRGYTVRLALMSGYKPLQRNLTTKPVRVDLLLRLPQTLAPPALRVYRSCAGKPLNGRGREIRYYTEIFPLIEEPPPSKLAHLIYLAS